MDPRGRKKLENCLKIHKKIDKNLDALNIINLKMTCDYSLQKEYPDKYLLMTKLERNTKYVKNCIDKYDLADRYKKPYACISTYSKSIQDVSMHIILHSEKKFITYKRKPLDLDNLKKLRCQGKLLKHMEKKIEFLMQQDLLHKYIIKVTGYYQTQNWRTNRDDNNTLEDKLRKFIAVSSLIKPEFFQNDKEEQFIFFVKLLHLCCVKNITDSKIIVGILSILIKIKAPKNEYTYIMPRPESSLVFFRYILQHIQNMDKQDIFFQQEDSSNAWEYLRSFSIADAVIRSDQLRVEDLICYGFNALPKDQQLNTEEDLSQVIPLEHRITLNLLENIQLHQMWIPSEFEITLTESQKKCFLIVLNHYTDFFVTKIGLDESLRIEYEFQMSRDVPRDKCEKEYRQKKRLVKMYATNFSKFAEAPKPKNAFKRFITLPYDEKDKFKSLEKPYDEKDKSVKDEMYGKCLAFF